MPPLRWGVVSAGTTAHDFVCAVSTLPESDHKVVAVAAKGLDNVQKFAELHGIAAFHVGYEALARDHNVGKSGHIEILFDCDKEQIRNNYNIEALGSFW